MSRASSLKCKIKNVSGAEAAGCQPKAHAPRGRGQGHPGPPVQALLLPIPASAPRVPLEATTHATAGRDGHKTGRRPQGQCGNLTQRPLAGVNRLRPQLGRRGPRARSSEPRAGPAALPRGNGPREGNVSCRKEGRGCPRKMAGSAGPTPVPGKPWAGRSRGAGGGSAGSSGDRMEHSHSW